MVGVNVHGLKNKDGNQASKGSNPFVGFTVGQDEKKLSSIVKVYDPPFTTSRNVFDHISKNLEIWVEEAIEVRKNV